MLKSTFFQLATVLAVIAPLGCAGVAEDSGSSSTVETQQALQAASPTCAAARDNCRTLAQPIIDQVQAACGGVRSACHGGTSPTGTGGAGATSAGTMAATGGTAVSCADARAACTAAIDTAKPQLQAVGQQCEPAVKSSCLVSGSHGGAAGGASGTGPGAGPVTTGAGGAAPGSPGAGGTHTVSQSCSDAQTACQQALAAAGNMPPAACVAISTSCMSTTATTSTTACTAAIDACHVGIVRHRYKLQKFRKHPGRLASVFAAGKVNLVIF